MLFSSNANLFIKTFIVHHDLDACHIFYNRSLYLYRVLLLYKVQCQVEVKLKFRILLSPTCVQLQILCLGQVVAIVTTLGRLTPMTQPRSCVWTITEINTFI